MIHRIGSVAPRLHGVLFVAWNAEIAGDVTLAPGTSVWFSATLRGDMAPITVGEGTNVQDGATLHVDTGFPLVIGSGVTIGHNAVLHGCTVGNDCLIGMGATVLNGARIGEGSIVGANALVTEGKTFPPRSLILGSPAKVARTIDDAMIEKTRHNAAEYRRLATAAAGSEEVPGSSSGSRA
jgi:carbonic anhydrase/acetyltransferase-like protein (isoleucine patch superfamily)